MMREQRAEDRIVEIVDRGVALAHRGPRLRHRARRRRRARHAPSPSRSAPFRGSSDDRLDLADIFEQRNALGDILGIVADPLDDAGDLERRDHVAQIVRHRRAQRDQLHGAPLGLDLEHVELLVVLDDLRPRHRVALDQAAHRLADRMLGEAAHLADQRAQPLKVLVEGLERVSD